MRKKKLSGLLSTGFIVLVFLIGVCLVAYPTVSNWWNERQASHAIDDYHSTVYSLDAEDQEILYQGALAYNKYIESDPEHWFPDEAEKAIYNSTLNVSGDGVMGYLTVPKLEINMPIYHGTGDEALQLGVGHMEGSSLPIGGEGTHCVLSGHTGLASAKLFTKLDQMEVGDTFTLSVLSEELTYQVVDIMVKLPEEMEFLEIQPFNDYCTLLTCTPYGVNTHRLLVRGERVKIPAAPSVPEPVIPEPPVEQGLVVPGIVLWLILILLILLLALFAVGLYREFHQKKGGG